MRQRATCRFCQLQPIINWLQKKGWMTKRCQMNDGIASSEKHLPNSQLISWPEQQHHITTLAPAGPAWVRHRTHLFCVGLKGGSVFPKHALQSASNASVLGITQSASGRWLCLTFKLSIGDTLWNDCKKNLMEPVECCDWHLVYLWTGVEGKGGLRKRQKNAVFHSHHLWQAVGSVLWCFLLSGLIQKKGSLGTNLHLGYVRRLKSFF